MFVFSSDFSRERDLSTFESLLGVMFPFAKIGHLKDCKNLIKHLPTIIRKVTSISWDKLPENIARIVLSGVFVKFETPRLSIRLEPDIVTIADKSICYSIFQVAVPYNISAIKQFINVLKTKNLLPPDRYLHALLNFILSLPEEEEYNVNIPLIRASDLTAFSLDYLGETPIFLYSPSSPSIPRRLQDFPDKLYWLVNKVVEAVSELYPKTLFAIQLFATGDKLVISKIEALSPLERTKILIYPRGSFYGAAIAKVDEKYRCPKLNSIVEVGAPTQRDLETLRQKITQILKSLQSKRD